MSSAMLFVLKKRIASGVVVYDEYDGVLVGRALKFFTLSTPFELEMAEVRLSCCIGRTDASGS